MTARLSLVVALALASSCAAKHVAKPRPTIVVLEPGTKPRQRLRYEPAPGLVETVESSTKVRIENRFTTTALWQEKSSADFPTIIIRGQLRVTGRSPEGHALVSFALDDIRTLEDVVDPAMRRTVDAQAHQVKDTRATWRLAPTGEVDDLKLEMPNATQGTHERFSTLTDSFREMFVPFPQADVGIGAIWQVESQPIVDGVTWTRKATYTLRELTDGQAIVDVSVAVQAASQVLRVEPNATTAVSSGTGTASGQAFVPRRGLVSSVTADATNEISLSIVRGRLRVSSTLRTQTMLSVKRLGSTADSGPHTAEPKWKSPTPATPAAP